MEFNLEKENKYVNATVYKNDDYGKYIKKGEKENF